MSGFGDQYAQIGTGTGYPVVEARVGRGNAATLFKRRIQALRAAIECVRKSDGRALFIADFAADRVVQMDFRLRCQIDFVIEAAFSRGRWRGLRADGRAARNAIQSLVAHRKSVCFDHWFTEASARFAFHAANLEDIVEIRVEAQAQADMDSQQAVIGQAQLLVADALPKQYAAENVYRAFRNHQFFFVVEILIGQIDSEQTVIALDRRIQQQWTAALQQQFEPRQESRAFMVDAMLAAAYGLDIAVAIEQRKRIVVLKHACEAIGARRSRGGIPVVADVQRVIHSLYEISGYRFATPLCRTLEHEGPH